MVFHKMEPHHIPIPYFLGIKMAVNPMIESIQSVGFSEIRPALRCRTSVKKDTGAIKISLPCTLAVVQKHNYSFNPDIYRIFHIQDERTSDRKR